MLDKMSANQRLMLAVAISIVFFVIYTAIFPPQNELAKDQQEQQKELIASDSQESVSIEQSVGHEIARDEKAQRGSNDTLVTITNENFIMKIDTLGRISSKELLEEKFNDGDNIHAQLIPEGKMKPLFIRFAEDELNKEALRTPYVASISSIALGTQPQKITLTQKLSEVTVTKEITFYEAGNYDVNISLSNDKRYFVYLGQRPEVTEQFMTVNGAMVYTADDKFTIVEDGDAEGRRSFNDVKLISAFDQYTATIMFGFRPDTNIILERDRQSNPIVYFEAFSNTSFSGYIGPKDYRILHSIDPVLVNAIEYGWFTFAAKPLFALLLWLHGIFGNWGWAIIGLTIIIRLVLYPLTHKGMTSMQKIKDIAPKIKEVQAKYKGDPQRMNAAVMDMYKKHGANPLGGCLPMLLQIPVFFAIYRVLLNAVELQGSEWILWMNDLSRHDPYFILPLLMGASMYYQQKLTPNNFTDPMQEKIFKFLPVIFTFFFLFFPSGLVLYWFVNNLFSIGQQFIVNQQFKNARAAREHASKHAEKKDDKN